MSSLFLPRGNHFLISRPAVTVRSDFGAQEEEICHYFHSFPFHYCEAIARSVLAQPHRHSPVLLRQLVQVMPPAWGPQGPQPRGAQTARPRRAQPCGAQTARPRRALHTLGQEQVFAPQHRALGSFGVRRAAGRRPAYPGTLASHLAPGASLGWVLAVAPQPQLPAP